MSTCSNQRQRLRGLSGELAAPLLEARDPRVRFALPLMSSKAGSIAPNAVLKTAPVRQYESRCIVSIRYSTAKGSLPTMKRSTSSSAATTGLVRHSSVPSPTPSIPASV